MLAIGAEAEPVADLDPVPQLYSAAGRIDAEEAARNRLVVAQRIEIDGAGVNAAMIVAREIVHADRLAFPRGEQIAALAGLIPMNQRASSEHESAARVEVHAADALAFGDQRFDVAAGIAPVDAAVGNIGEVKTAEVVHTRRFEQAVAAREHLEFHRCDPPPARLTRFAARGEPRRWWLRRFAVSVREIDFDRLRHPRAVLIVEPQTAMAQVDQHWLQNSGQ